MEEKKEACDAFNINFTQNKLYRNETSKHVKLPHITYDIKMENSKLRKLTTEKLQLVKLWIKNNDPKTHLSNICKFEII